MKGNSILRLLPLGLLAASVSIASVSCHGGSATTTEARVETKADTAQHAAQAPQDKEELTESVQGEVDSGADDQIQEKRKKISKEAVKALEATREALRALDEKKTDEALAALERATGKLGLILARQPDLALAPTRVSVSTLDVLTTLEAIEEARDAAEDALEAGKVQHARALLSGLGSEIVVSVTSIPLASYPAAIKAVIPLIDDGKIDEAKLALAAALRTLVVTNHVIPLPVVRAEAMLADAEELAEKKEREEGENQELTSLLENARYQLHLAEALGYGSHAEYERMFGQLDQIEEKTRGGKSGEGFFDEIEASIAEMKKSVFG